MDDLNYLLRRQQQEHSRAVAAGCAAAKSAHLQMAERYELRIEQLTSGRLKIYRLPSAAPSQ